MKVSKFASFHLIQTRTSFLLRFFGIITIGAVIMSCSLFKVAGYKQGIQLTTDYAAIQGDPQEAMASAEEQNRSWLKEGLRDALGPDAESLFMMLDSARQDALQKFAPLIQPGGQGSLPVPYAGTGFNKDGIQFAALIRPAHSRQSKGLAGLILILATAPIMMENNSNSQGVPIEIGLPKSSESGESEQISLKLTPSGNNLTAEVNSEFSATAADGASIDERSSGHLEMNICPDPNGQIVMTFTVQMQMTSTSGKPSLNRQIEFTGTINAQVDDNAEVASTEEDSKMSMANQSNSGKPGEQTNNQFLEFGIQSETTYAGSISPAKINGKITPLRAGGNLTPDNQSSVKSLFDLEHGFLTVALAAARDKWQNGFCVEILSDGVQDTNPVDPDSTTKFTGRVRQIFEDKELKAGLQGTLSGEKQLDPQTKKVAPVEFTYQAGSQRGKKGTITLETRSMRGAAQKTITFYTGETGWKIDENVTINGYIFHFSGLSCQSVFGPWEINMTGSLPGTSFNYQIKVAMFDPYGKADADWDMNIKATGYPAGAIAKGKGDALLKRSGEDSYQLILKPPSAEGFGYAGKFFAEGSSSGGVDMVLTPVQANESECP